jgi:hypothetical protein
MPADVTLAERLYSILLRAYPARVFEPVFARGLERRNTRDADHADPTWRFLDHRWTARTQVARRPRPACGWGGRALPPHPTAQRAVRPAGAACLISRIRVIRVIRVPSHRKSHVSEFPTGIKG